MSGESAPRDGRRVATGTTRTRTDYLVFGVAGTCALAFVLWGALGTRSLTTVTSTVLSWIETNFGWAFVLAVTGFVSFVLWLAFSRYGKITLGPEDEQPRFKTLPWTAMMFAAGMGIGLIFYGVAEPLQHYTSPPPGTAAPGTDKALETSMATTMFHWALHPWSCYAVAGLAIAYSTHRRGRPALVSAACAPLLGRRARGPVGKLVDILAIFATLFGMSASLGLSALQISSGMQAAGFMRSVSNALLVIVVLVLTAGFIFSAISGVERGVQWLAATNGGLAVAVALFVFVVGPTVFILNLIPTALGDYLKDLPAMAARTEASGGRAMAEWLSHNTIFYWAWWISWTPFVGMFIARISRGRTIRQFVGGVLLVPTVISLVWFAIFGGAAIQQQRTGARLASRSVEGQFFGLLQHYPIATATSLVVMILVAIFFISGADASAIVMGSLSQRGAEEPTKSVIAFWGALTGGVAVIMLIIGGGDATALTGLQNLTIIVASPFVVVLVLLALGLVRDLRQDEVVLRDDKGTEVITDAVEHGTKHYGETFYLQVEAHRKNQDESENERVTAEVDGSDESE